jgi:hypothetical protein
MLLPLLLTLVVPYHEQHSVQQSTDAEAEGAQAVGAMSVNPGPRRNAYVIASREHFDDGRVEDLSKMLRHVNFIRVEPVNSSAFAQDPANQQCRNSLTRYGNWNDWYTNLRRQFQSHRNAWSAIALSEGGERALVLEADFQYRPLTEAQLISKINYVWSMDDDDLTHIGWNDWCADSDRSPCWGGSTAYVLSNRLARLLIRLDSCELMVDQLLVGSCPYQDALMNETYSWASEYQYHLFDFGRARPDPPLKCSFLYEPSQIEGSGHFGIFQGFGKIGYEAGSGA